MPANASAKETLRAEIRKKLRALPPEQLERESQSIRDTLSFRPNERVAFFANLPTEPQLLSLITRYPETHWHLPRVIGNGLMEFIRIQSVNDLKPGPFGIREPIDGPIISRFDTILCPGVAFAYDGSRLGQGGGFYDRFLAEQRTAKILGVAFQCQLVDQIPSDHHDIRMDAIISSPEEPVGKQESQP